MTRAPLTGVRGTRCVRLPCRSGLGSAASKQRLCGIRRWRQGVRPRTAEKRGNRWWEAVTCSRIHLIG